MNLTKHTLICVLYTLCMALALNAQEGIIFESTTFEEALNKAANEEKLVFVDAYTSWCGPCKKMSKHVFPNPAVGQFYNRQFVNLKIDMEKGEGPTIARRYGVRSYPTFLYLTPTGDLIHRVSGYRPPEIFINVGKDATDPSKQLKVLEKKYNAAKGKPNPDLLLEYAMALHSTYDQRAYDIGEAYLAAVQNSDEPSAQKLIFALADRMDKPFFGKVTDNKKDYVARFGRQTVENKLKSAISEHLYKNINKTSFKEAKKLAKKHITLKLFPEFLPKYSVYHALTEKDYSSVSKGINKLLEQENFHDESMFKAVAWIFDQQVEDDKFLRQALEWVTLWNQKENTYDSMDALAHIQFKLGMVDEARQSAEQALVLAEKENKKASSTRELIHKILN